MQIVAQEHALQDMVSVGRFHDLPSQRWHGCFGTTENPPLGCPKSPRSWHPTYLTDFQRPLISLDIFKYIFQKFKCVGYVSNCCSLPYMSAHLICHELQPQFAAHTKLLQEHSSSKITQVDANWYQQTNNKCKEEPWTTHLRSARVRTSSSAVLQCGM